MADVTPLEFLAEMEGLFGIEVSKSNKLEGTFSGIFNEESEVRVAASSGRPRLMVKAEIQYPVAQAGRNGVDFYGWFGKDSEATRKVRGMFLGAVNSIIEAAPTINTSALATAFRALPKGTEASDNKTAHEAMDSIAKAIRGHSVSFKVTQNAKKDSMGKETGETQSRLYFLSPSDPNVLALTEDDQAV